MNNVLQRKKRTTPPTGRPRGWMGIRSKTTRGCTAAPKGERRTIKRMKVRERDDCGEARG